MSEDWKRGYQEGFSDGYMKAFKDFEEDRKPYNPPNLWSDNIPTPGCRVCGIKWDKPMGYVCSRYDCPGKITSGPNNPNISYSYGPKNRTRFKAD